MGTVEFGVNYGIQVPGEGQPTENEAISLIHKAIDFGINFLDTAPNYGNSEEIVGKALASKKNVYIASKINIPKNDNGELLSGKELKQFVDNSINKSLKDLKRETIDFLQIHNATKEIIQNDEMTHSLKELVRLGKVKHIGASVYGEENADALINSKDYQGVQLAYNILDQRMRYNIFQKAEKANKGIMCRSVYLKGALTSKAQWLPDELIELKKHVEKIRDHFQISYDDMAQLALRFVLSSNFINTVLVGISNKKELDEAIKIVQQGALDNKEIETLNSFALTDEKLINPSYWSVP